MTRLFPFVSAALFATAILVMMGATARASEPEISAKARAHFMAGVEYLKSKNYEEAYREFKAAHASTPTWKILGNLGIAADELERDGEAINALEQYLEQGQAELSGAEAKQVHQDLERLRSDSAVITIHGPERLWIVDRRQGPTGLVINQYGPFDRFAELRVRAGKHELQLAHSGTGAPPNWAVTLLPGQTANHSFVVEPEAVPVDVEPNSAIHSVGAVDSESQTASYVLWGTGAVAAVASSVLFLQSTRLQEAADKEFERACPLGALTTNVCAQTTDGDEKAADWRTAALVTGAGALGALVAGTVIYWLNPVSKSADRRDGDEATIGPILTPMGIRVTGTF